MSNTEAMRADFEAWAIQRGHPLSDIVPVYGPTSSMPQTERRFSDIAYEAWQAATAQATAPLEAAIKKVHAAKGRHHNQIAMCDLYELVGLPCVRPDAIRKANHD